MFIPANAGLTFASTIKLDVESTLIRFAFTFGVAVPGTKSTFLFGNDGPRFCPSSLACDDSGVVFVLVLRVGRPETGLVFVVVGEVSGTGITSLLEGAASRIGLIFLLEDGSPGMGFIFVLHDAGPCTAL